MFGRYAYFKNSLYQDSSVKGEYSPITNSSSLVSALPSSLFKNTDYFPDILTYNYTDVEFRYEPNKLSLDEIVLNLFYMIPYTLYVASQRKISTSLEGIGSSESVVFDKEDIILDINNIPHIDVLYELEDDSVEYLITPQSSDWSLLLSYMENSRRAV